MADSIRSIFDFFAGMQGIFSSPAEGRYSSEFDEDLKDPDYIDQSADKENLRNDRRNIAGDISRAHEAYLKR